MLGQCIFFTAKDPHDMENYQAHFNKGALNNNKSTVGLDTTIEY